MILYTVKELEATKHKYTMASAITVSEICSFTIFGTTSYAKFE